MKSPLSDRTPDGIHFRLRTHVLSCSRPVGGPPSHPDFELSEGERASAEAAYPDERFLRSIGERLSAADALLARFHGARTEQPAGHARWYGSPLTTVRSY